MELQYRTLLRDDLKAARSLMLSTCQSIPQPVRLPVATLIMGGGKRLRPALVLLSAYLCDADPGKALLAAAAVEMLHTATLIHDDLIDNSFIRRGVETLNVQWSSTATVLAGDIVFALAAKLIAQTENPFLIERFAVALETICRGELDQMIGRNGSVPEIDAYYERIYAKTASLITLCAESGPILAGSSMDTITQSRRFGRLLGEAYQITDDVLDLLGDTQRLGKPVGSDLRQGLVTLPVLLYAEAVPEDKRVHQIAHGDADERTISSFITDLLASNAADQALAMAQSRADEALAIIQEYPDTVYRRAAEEIVHFSVRRAY